jgi:hypothetical protein
MKFAAAAIAVTLLGQQPTADVLRARLAEYLTQYEPRLSELIADELLVQENKRGSRRTGGIGPREYRTIHAEVAFIALPGDAGWLGFRRVTKVGGNPVNDALSSLNAALTAGAQDDYSKARAMLADSARYNLGTPRTTNLPNLPLELLHQRNAHRFTVRVDGQQHVRGKRTTRLIFVEMVSPTIIRSQSGGNMQSTVTAFVEPDGRIWRADVITVDRLRFEHLVSVEFQQHRQLGLLVPATMHEEFFAGDNRDAQGDATYRNYRRFQTSARIVPQN